MTTIEFVKKAIEIHKNKYDYSNVVYKRSREKIKIICKKHGIFEQTPNNHLNGKGCIKCQYDYTSKIFVGNTENFIRKAIKIHKDKYDYSIVEYKKSSIKIKIICKKHGIFEQTPNKHLSGRGCQKCNQNFRLTTDEFISKAANVHNNKYDYSLSDYKTAKTKIKIICKKHGIFEQTPNGHLMGSGCHICATENNNILSNGNKICSKCKKEKPNTKAFFTFVKNKKYLKAYCIECENKVAAKYNNKKAKYTKQRYNKLSFLEYIGKNNKYIEVKCRYCDKKFIPTNSQINNRLNSINNIGDSNHFYCSDECKLACPSYGKITHQEGAGIGTSREIPSSFRKIVFNERGLECEKCGSKENGLHIHHIEGYTEQKMFIADLKNVLVVCKRCHELIHKIPGCSKYDYRCNNRV